MVASSSVYKHQGRLARRQRRCRPRRRLPLYYRSNDPDPFAFLLLLVLLFTVCKPCACVGLFVAIVAPSSVVWVAMHMPCELPTLKQQHHEATRKSYTWVQCCQQNWNLPFFLWHHDAHMGIYWNNLTRVERLLFLPFDGKERQKGEGTVEKCCCCHIVFKNKIHFATWFGGGDAAADSNCK